MGNADNQEELHRVVVFHAWNSRIRKTDAADRINLWAKGKQNTTFVLANVRPLWPSASSATMSDICSAEAPLHDDRLHMADTPLKGCVFSQPCGTSSINDSCGNAPRQQFTAEYFWFIDNQSPACLAHHSTARNAHKCRGVDSA